MSGCNFGCVSGYLFSSDILAAMDKYSGEVAGCVMEKAKKMCRDLLPQQDVSVIVLFVRGLKCHLAY